MKTSKELGLNIIFLAFCISFNLFVLPSLFNNFVLRQRSHNSHVIFLLFDVANLQLVGSYFKFAHKKGTLVDLVDCFFFHMCYVLPLCHEVIV
jgi:hypothetical protein